MRVHLVAGICDACARGYRRSVSPDQNARYCSAACETTGLRRRWCPAVCAWPHKRRYNSETAAFEHIERVFPVDLTIDAYPCQRGPRRHWHVGHR